MTAKEKGKQVLEKALGDVVNPIVDVLDVDGVAQRIDVNELVQKIDVDALVQRIDINALLEKVDINALLDKSDLAAIVAQSSSGVFAGVMDSLRFQVVRVDLFLLRIFQFGKAILPPAPGMIDQQTPLPKKTSEKAIAVQLHYSGLFSKTVALGIDAAILFVTLSLFTLLLEEALKRINDLLIILNPDQDKLNQGEFVVESFLNIVSPFLYFWVTIALTGQTIGMAIVGVRVVNANGDKDVSISRSAIRAAGLVVTIVTWPFAMPVGLHRRDGRMPHDLVARTGVVFKWNARLARLRKKPILDDDGSMASQDSTDAQQGSASGIGLGGSNISEHSNQVDNEERETNAPNETERLKNSITDKPPNTLNVSKSRAAGSSTAKAYSKAKPRRSSTKRMAPAQATTETSGTAVPRTITLASAMSPENGSDNGGVLSVVASPPSSSLLQVLNEGRNDLQNVKPSGIIGFVFNPIRSFVLDPSLAIAAAVLPPIVSVVPFADTIAAAGFYIPFQAAKISYGLIGGAEESATQDVNLDLVAHNAILSMSEAGAARPPQMTASDSLQCLVRVSRSLGITTGNNIVDVSQFGGRLLDDMKVLRKIQQEKGQQKNVRRYRQLQIQEAINEGSRTMSFALAAYATGLIQYDLDQNNVASVQELDIVKMNIAQHIGINVGDVKLICMNGVDKNMKLLRHFVAIDRESSSVVLAIAGTFFCPVSLESDATEFCTGLAHKGLSEVANSIWDVSGAVIERLFAQLESENDSLSWSFVIVGHSIGAGAATLLNIKCHVESLLGGRQVKCFGFASPPAFNRGENEDEDPATSTAIGSAMASSTCYIYGDDCVPFLSQTSVSLLAVQIETVDDACRRLWHRDRAALASGRVPIPQVLIHDVTRVDPPHTLELALFKIPAGRIVWTRKSSGSFKAIGCLADDLANLDITVSATMIRDHLPSEYQTSLDQLVT